MKSDASGVGLVKICVRLVRSVLSMWKGIKDIG